MNNYSKKEKIKQFFHRYDSSIGLFFILLIFFTYALFIAINLQKDIIPDEKTHFLFSRHFSTTLGIPQDNSETLTRGVLIKHNPFLYYWINGRIINIFKIIIPTISDWQLLISLRILNVFYALGTVIFCYLFSKEILKHKWWRLLPVFILTNTIMFVFLAGGINYDNLANLFCMAGLFFLARILNHHDFVPNSLAWMICIAAGALTKYTVLPLALAMGVVWVIFFIKNNEQVFPLKIEGKIFYILCAILFLLIIGNLAIYGYNFVAYKSILPDCEMLFTKEQCSLSIYKIRRDIYGLNQKLSLSESINLGYPGPIKYFFTMWIPDMFYKIYGILGHLTYYPQRTTTLHLAFFYWLILLSIVYRKNFSYIIYNFLVIFFFYTLVLFIKNYNTELIYGFKHFALQGRYIFPVLGIAYIFLAKVIMKIPHKMVQKLTLVFALLLYFFTGPLTFIYRYNAVFSDWFIR